MASDADVDDDVGAPRFERIAGQVVENLGAPDIVALQEVQDNDGAEKTGLTDASETLRLLIEQIVRPARLAARRASLSGALHQLAPVRRPRGRSLVVKVAPAVNQDVERTIDRVRLHQGP